jgi:large subunit ribosomal protein L10
LNGSLAGQLAVVTGKKDISAAAKALKNFAAEFDKLKLKFGYLNNQRLDEASIRALADLPSLDVLRAKLLGLFNAPATKLAVLLNTPATQLAQVIKAKAEKAEKAETDGAAATPEKAA